MTATVYRWKIGRRGSATMRALLSALAVTVALAATVAGGTYYVDQGNPLAADTNSGTEALPWKTLAKAVAGRSPGDTVIFKRGIYRESVSLPVSGVAGSPITLKGQSGHRVVLSGADQVTGWTQCTQAMTRGNPNWANIHYADVAWKPTRLAQDVADLSLARTPAHGKWLAGGGTTTTLIDAANLTQADGYWNGAILFLYDRSAGVTYERNVIDFNAASHTLTVDAIWYTTRVNLTLPSLISAA